MKVNGKDIDVLYGIKDGKSEIQAYRYPTPSFSSDEAKAHCESKKGSFHPAQKSTSAMRFLSKSDWAMEEKELRSVIEMINDDAETFFDVGDVSFREPKIENNKAVIELVGPLFKYSNILTVIGVGTSLEDASHQLDQAISMKKTGKIKEVKFAIDSPGGQASGVDAFASKVHETTKIMPVHGTVSGMCCSGAYWIGSAMSSLTATSDTDIFGGIGAVMAITKDSDDEFVFVSGNAPNKRPNPETDEGKAVLQQHLDMLEGIFIEKVAVYRGVTTEKVKKDFGKGGTLFTKEALKVGMIDSIQTSNGGNMEITVQSLRENYPEVVSDIEASVIAKKDEEITALKGKIAELETNEPIENDLPPEAQAKINEYQSRIEALEKENLAEKLSFCSDEEKNTLVGLYGKLDTEVILKLGGMLKAYQEKINAIGGAQGSTEVPDPETEKQTKKQERIQQLVASGMPESDAIVQVEKEFNL
jgi:ClpP class serine protease